MRLIDADALLGNYKGNILTAQTDYAQGARDIIDDIRNAPTVDAIPVVRCKDCKHANMTYGGECKYCDIWSKEGAIYLPGDFYCDCEERKDD